MRSSLALLLLAATALLSACRDAKVSNYRVPRETPAPLPPILTGALPAAAPAAPVSGGTSDMASMANTAVATAQGDGLRWTAPAHWQPKPASAMRKGSYTVPGPDGATADLAITAFPGDVGGDLANFNRWRGQIQLPPLAPAEVPGASVHLDANGLHFTVVDFAHPAAEQPQRILGAIVPLDGATWFFKLMGPDALVAAEKPAFLAFLQSVQPTSPAGATHDHAHP